MENKPNYYAIIPANVRYSNITANAKLLYGEITALTNQKGYCYATNDYFAKLYNVSKVSISKWIKELIENDFITSELIFKQSSKEILNRYIRIVVYPIKENLNTPIKEKLKDNTTSINNTINKEKEIKEIAKQFKIRWNEFATRNKLPTILKDFDDGKIKAFSARLKECGNYDKFCAIISENWNNSEFIRGENNAKFVFNLTFILQKKSFSKMMNKEYYDRDYFKEVSNEY